CRLEELRWWHPHRVFVGLARILDIGLGLGQGVRCRLVFLLLQRGCIWAEATVESRRSEIEGLAQVGCVVELALLVEQRRRRFGGVDLRIASRRLGSGDRWRQGGGRRDW